MRITTILCDVCETKIEDKPNKDGYLPDRSVMFQGGNRTLQDICDSCQETVSIAKLRIVLEARTKKIEESENPDNKIVADPGKVRRK
jgi:hypothetical protein